MNCLDIDAAVMTTPRPEVQEGNPAIASPNEFVTPGNGRGPLVVQSLENPSLTTLEMPLSASFYPLGFRVDISTNYGPVLIAAESSWGRFPAKPFLEPSAQLYVAVAAKTSSECPPAPLFRAHRHLVSLIADPENFVTCDLSRAVAFASISKGAVERPSYLHYHFLDAAMLTLLVASRLTPVHAACVERDGRGVLLCGDSGAGKSSLAFACARAGWTYITDDASYLVSGRRDRMVVGNSTQIRFRPSASALFPELAGMPVTPRAAGKPSIEVPTGTLSYLKTATESQVKHIVFLNRRESSAPGILPCRRKALEWFARTVRHSAMREIHMANLRRLLAIPVHELRYTALEWAVSRLEELVLRGDEQC